MSTLGQYGLVLNTRLIDAPPEEQLVLITLALQNWRGLHLTTMGWIYVHLSMFVFCRKVPTDNDIVL